MNFFIVIFLPSILGLFTYNVLVKEKDYFNLIIVYLLNVLFTNLINITYLFLKSREMYSLTYRIEGDYRFAYKYILLALACSSIFAFVFAFIKKYFSITMEVENGNKKKKKV